MKNVVEFFVCRIRTKPEPRESVVLVVAENIAKRLRSVPTVRLGLVVRDDHEVRPVKFVSNRLEHKRYASPRPGNAYRRVVGL